MNDSNHNPSDSEPTREVSVDGTANEVDSDCLLEQPNTFLQKYSTLILCIALFAIPIVGQSAVRALKVYSSDVTQWLPSKFEQAETYDWFKNEFGVDEMMVVSWEGCTLTDPRLQQVQAALEQAQMNEQPAFDRVTSGPDMLQRILDVGVSERLAKARLRGLVIGPCLLYTSPSPRDS